MSDKQIIITIAGPSTSGKSTLANLFKPEGYQEIVSTTTRPQRTGEIDGVHYHFVNQETFDQLLSDNELVEHAPVGKYFYGVSKKAIQNVLNSGNSAVLVLEPKGANEVAKFCVEKNLENHKVFINNPMEILIRRLHERYENDLNRNDDVYKDRLWNIGFIEPREWTNKAYSGEHHYDQIFDTFTPQNQDSVLKDILEQVQKKLNKTSKRKP
jgi:guanylate kinase